MAQIYADPERMKILSDLYIQKANRLTDSQSKTLSAAQGIAQNFTGTAISGVFATAVDGIKRNYNSMYDVLNSYAGFLNGAALTYEATDESLGRAILALTGGVAVAISGGRSITLDNPSGHKLIDNDLDYYKNKFYSKRYNCKEFARSVIQDTLGKNIPATGNPDYTLKGVNPIVNGQLVYGRNSITEDSVRQMFAGAQNGDVVQMHWDWGKVNTVHSAVFLGVDTNGIVQFLEANNPTGEIRKNTYTYAKLAELYNHSGCGASIYRF